MKKVAITIIALSLLVLTGCDDQNAREYAKELVGVLKTYQVEVNKKIAAEKKSYKELSSTHAYARQVNLLTTLRTERLQRAESLTDALLSGEKFTPSDMHKVVLDYAKLDFESTREALVQESNGQAEYLASLETLEMQSQNISALIKALDAMAKPKSDLKKLKELGNSAKEFKNKFNDLQCDELTEQIACLKAHQQALGQRTDLTPQQKTSRKEKIDEEIKQLMELSDTQECDRKKRDEAKCPSSKG